MNMTGAFHTAGDFDRLYVERKEGGLGLRSIEDMYGIRIVGLKKHLDEVSKQHSLLNMDRSINSVRNVRLRQVELII